MNNKKYHTEQFKQKQKEKTDRIYGPIEKHKKICEICKNEYIFEGRIKTKAYEKSKFCSIKCSKSRQSWWNNNAKKYRTIAFQHWDKKCSICGFDKVITIHHYDENNKNNDYKNLIPLCPNHHEMIHNSKWKKETKLIVEQIIKERKSKLDK